MNYFETYTAMEREAFAIADKAGLTKPETARLGHLIIDLAVRFRDDARSTRMQDVTRLEVIGDSGRLLTLSGVSVAQVQLQDDDRTIKVFVKGEVPAPSCQWRPYAEGSWLKPSCVPADVSLPLLPVKLRAFKWGTIYLTPS